MNTVFESDLPGLIPDEEDIFGHDDFARVLAAAVMETSADYTFGLFGDWGLGKTTVLQAVQAKLEKRSEQCAFVTFDAWRYQDDPFRREFVRELVEQVEDKLKSWDEKEQLRALDEDVAVASDKGLQFSVPEFLRGLLGLGLLVAVLIAVCGWIIVDPGAGAPVTLALTIPPLTYVALRWNGSCACSSRPLPAVGSRTPTASRACSGTWSPIWTANGL
jgi:hypothetical protein